MCRSPELFRREFFALPNDLYAATQRTGRILEQLALPGSANQPALAGAEIILGESDQGRDQFRKPVAAAGRNFEPGSRLPQFRRTRLTDRVQIDLVTNH